MVQNPWGTRHGNLHNTVHDSSGIVDSGGSLREDGKTDEWILSNILLVKDESNETNTTEDEWNKGSPRVPWVHGTSPSNWNQETGARRHKNNTANPVNSSQLGSHAAWNKVELEEDWDHQESNTAEWEIDPENPGPRNTLGKCTSHDGSEDATKSPHHGEETKVLASLSKRDQVGDDNFRNSDKTAASHTLDGSASEDDSEILCQSTNDGTGSEENQRGKQ